MVVGGWTYFLSLRIGGGACPAGGVGDFTTCLLLGACTLHCFLIRTSALDAHDLFEHDVGNLCQQLHLSMPPFARCRLYRTLSTLSVNTVP